MDTKIGDRVRCGLAGPLYGTNGIVTQGGLRARPEFTFIRWDGHLISSRYRPGHPILETLQPIPHADERRAYGVNPETGEKILCWMDRDGNPQA